MAKSKSKKDGKNAQSHIRARLEYLRQAAAYFQEASQQPSGHKDPNAGTRNAQGTDDLTSNMADTSREHEATPLVSSQQAGQSPLTNISRVCVSQMRSVSMKTQNRLPVELKRSLCKRCDTLLVPGVNCSREIRNASRGGKKPWADVLVLRCSVCQTEKRFPQTEKRSKKLAERRKETNLYQAQATES